ncbi:hypothetical protein ACFLX9_03485 [Chloroflexota bacterium]
MNVRPLSQAQTNTLLALAESYSPTESLKALNKAMLYILLDGTLRISELLTATRYQLAEDGRPLDYEGVKSLFQRWKRPPNGAFQGVRLSAHTLRPPQPPCDASQA